jgi:hypothetical protein
MQRVRYDLRCGCQKPRDESEMIICSLFNLNSNAASKQVEDSCSLCQGRQTVKSCDIVTGD